ncbi:MAG: 2-oxoacid:acceptor oxidoreductase subunit alpha [candidate division WOR-3 bacterium]|nr:2-oxoacid:acceptor oxidoreductase subunit alpha [candidate division WOR-3 bacterium]
MNELNLIVAGHAGQGLQVISRTLGRLLVRAGYYVFVSQDVMSRIRGGHNSARVRVSTRPVAADGDKAEILIALDPALVAWHVDDLAPDASVVTDVTGDLPEGLNAVRLPLVDLAREYGKDPVMVNAVAVGAALALVGLELTGLEDLFAGEFARKGEDVVRRNMAAAEAGYKAVIEDMKRSCPHRLAGAEPGDRLLISGAEALALGAIAAGVRVVTGYPMSPATPIVEYCFRHAQEAGLIVEQTEDEVSAANLAIGAAFAGARAMTCTAGGGFCLMNEALSLAGMTETPLVLCVGMRPGPATGMATRTAQADLLFAIYAGHGEFPRAVLTPADAGQAFQAAQDAFRIAEKYQTPVIILFDQFMADALWTVERNELKVDNRQGRQERQVPDGAEAYAYRRYEMSENGVSPRLLPGTPQQLVYADSDEHTEAGHITESTTMRVRMVDKRNAKTAGIRQELEAPKAEVEVEVEVEAETLVFCFGSSRGVVAEAVTRLRDKGSKVAMVHLTHVWPFPVEAVAAPAAKSLKVVTVEQNYSGQLAQLLLQECGLRVTGTVRRYDGRQFAVAEVETGLEELIGVRVG